MICAEIVGAPHFRLTRPSCLPLAGMAAQARGQLLGRGEDGVVCVLSCRVFGGVVRSVDGCPVAPGVDLGAALEHSLGLWLAPANRQRHFQAQGAVSRRGSHWIGAVALLAEFADQRASERASFPMSPLGPNRSAHEAAGSRADRGATGELVSRLFVARPQCWHDF